MPLDHRIHMSVYWPSSIVAPSFYVSSLLCVAVSDHHQGLEPWESICDGKESTHYELTEFLRLDVVERTLAYSHPVRQRPILQTLFARSPLYWRSEEHSRFLRSSIPGRDVHQTQLRRTLLAFEPPGHTDAWQ